MAWCKRKSPTRRGLVMKNAETSLPQPWACSNISPKDEFLSLQDNIGGGSVDWEKKNIESLVFTSCLQEASDEAPVLFAMHKPGSKVVFPQITTRVSVVGKKVYCSTYIHSSITWHQKNSLQRIQSSMMFLNFHQRRSSNSLPGVKLPEIRPIDLVTVVMPDPSPDTGQCRGVIFSLARAGGMRLICPPLQLPLLEILLFSHQQLSSQKRATLLREGCLWRFLLNLALSILRPFCGSLLRRCLIALIFIVQMRINKNLSDQGLSYMPDLCSFILYQSEHIDVKELTICSKPIQLHNSISTGVEDAVQGANLKSRSVLSDIGGNFDGECCRKCVLAVGVPISVHRDPPSVKIPVFLEQNTGSDICCSDNRKFSVVNVEIEDEKLEWPQTKSGKFASRYEEIGLTSQKRLRAAENGLPLRKRLHVDPTIRVGTESGLVPPPVLGPDCDCDFASSPSTQCHVEFCSSFLNEDPGKISAAEISEEIVEVPSLTDTMNSEEVFEQQAELPSVPQTMLRGEFCLMCRECSKFALMEPVDNLSVKDIDDGKCVPHDFGKRPGKVPKWEDDSLKIEEHRIATNGCVSLEGSEKQIEACISESTSAEDGLELSSPGRMRGNNFESSYVRDVCTLEKYGNECLVSSQDKIIGNDHAHPSSERTRERGHDRYREETVSPDYPEADSKSSLLEHRGFHHFTPSEHSRTISSANRHEKLAEAGNQSLQQESLPIAAVQEELSTNPQDDSTEIFARVAEGLSDARDLMAADEDDRIECALTETIRKDESAPDLQKLDQDSVFICRNETEIECATTKTLTRDDSASDLHELDQASVFSRRIDTEAIHEKFNSAGEDEQIEMYSQVAEGMLDAGDVIQGDIENRIECATVETVTKGESVFEVDEVGQSSVFFGGTGTDQEDSSRTEMCPTRFPVMANLCGESPAVTENYPEHPFADHPTCIELRAHRHSHGDQHYIDMQDLVPAPWGQLIFWHGRCKEGRPTLCVLLGRAVRQLPSQELKQFIAVAVSHLEYAEMNYFKGPVKQMNILMDLEGLGFMRLPPMSILSSISAVLNRDYAGRGGCIILVNAPVMLGLVISAIQRVILRPVVNKGAGNDGAFKGFLDGKERIVILGCKYRLPLGKFFETSMLPCTFGGDCNCTSDESPCTGGINFLRM